MKYKKTIIFLGSITAISGGFVGLFFIKKNKQKKETPKVSKIIDLKDEIEKLQNFETIDSSNSELANAKKDRDVTNLFNEITNSNNFKLSSGVTISLVKVQTPKKNKKVIFSITLSKGENKVKNNTKNITVTFGKTCNLFKEIIKIKDFRLINKVDEEENDFTKNDKKGADITSKFNKLLKFKNNEPSTPFLNAKFSKDVWIEKVLLEEKYDNKNFYLTVKIILNKKNIDTKVNNEKYIKIYFNHYDMQEEINKIQDFKTQDSINKILVEKKDQEEIGKDIKAQFLKISEISKGNINPKSFKKQRFIKDTQIESIKIKTQYDKKTKTLVVTVTLSNSKYENVYNNKKDIKIIFS